MQIVDLDATSSQPEGWRDHQPPPAAPWTDTSIYELHIRDFRWALPAELAQAYSGMLLYELALCRFPCHYVRRQRPSAVPTVQQP